MTYLSFTTKCRRQMHSFSVNFVVEEYRSNYLFLPKATFRVCFSAKMP